MYSILFYDYITAVSIIITYYLFVSVCAKVMINCLR